MWLQILLRKKGVKRARSGVPTVISLPHAKLGGHVGVLNPEEHETECAISSRNRKSGYNRLRTKSTVVIDGANDLGVLISPCLESQFGSLRIVHSRFTLLALRSPMSGMPVQKLQHPEVDVTAADL